MLFTRMLPAKRKKELLIEYGSEEQIINAVTLLIEDRKTRLELSNRAMHDIKQYSWDSYGNKLRSFISNL